MEDATVHAHGLEMSHLLLDGVEEWRCVVGVENLCGVGGEGENPSFSTAGTGAINGNLDDSAVSEV